MNSAYVTTGIFINNNTLILDENFNISNKKVRIVIEPVIEENNKKRKFGCLKGKIIIKDDFDEPLEEFKEYMEWNIY